MKTNCKNCGAPLKFHKCEYCGTNYYENSKTNESPDVAEKTSTMTYLENVAEKVSSTMTYSEYLAERVVMLLE